nr:putative tRNA (guanine(26)-N(2))-dimethyltransferase 2 [Ipomoea trifida]
MVHPKRWVQLIPSLDPCDHGICQLVKVIVNLAKLRFHLLRQLEVARLDSGAVLRESRSLEKRDQLLLPVDALVLLLKVHERIASFAMPDVGQTGLHS